MSCLSRAQIFNVLAWRLCPRGQPFSPGQCTGFALPWAPQGNGSSSQPGLGRVGLVPSSPSIPGTATSSPHLTGSACLDSEGDVTVSTPQPFWSLSSTFGFIHQQLFAFRFAPVTRGVTFSPTQLGVRPRTLPLARGACLCGPVPLGVPLAPGAPRTTTRSEGLVRGYPRTAQ